MMSGAKFLNELNLKSNLGKPVLNLSAIIYELNETLV